MVEIEAGRQGVRFSVHARPRASRTEPAGTHGDAFAIRLAAPPVEGAANDELIRFLSKELGVPKSAVRIVRGRRGSRKRVHVEGVRPAEVRALLDRD